MENKLATTNTIGDKIRRFFNKLFRKNYYIEQTSDKSEIKDADIIKKSLLQDTISYKAELEEKQRKEEMAQELLNGSIECEELTEEELEEMTEYFSEDIKKQEQELKRIKMHIMEMRKELQNNM